MNASNIGPLLNSALGLSTIIPIDGDPSLASLTSVFASVVYSPDSRKKSLSKRSQVGHLLLKIFSGFCISEDNSKFTPQPPKPSINSPWLIILGFPLLCLLLLHITLPLASQTTASSHPPAGHPLRLSLLPCSQCLLSHALASCSPLPQYSVALP